MGRHLMVHLGGALAAVGVACAVPMVATWLVGRGWLVVLAAFALATPTLLVAFTAKVLRWVRAPIAYRIPLTVGQQGSIRSIRHDPSGSPHTAGQVLLRALFDIVLFRPLTRATPSARFLSALDHGATRSLWLAALAFHASFAVILVRHLRVILQPVPSLVAWLEDTDALGELTLPRIHVSSTVFVLALGFLLGRRLWLARLRYVSLAADYFPLLLLLAIATTGLLMRHVLRADLSAVKQVVTGIANGALPSTQADVLLVAHLCLVAVLLAYVPGSKLMHMTGVWLSPTLTLANTSRGRRHVNPNNPEVPVLHYADYEDAFRGPMVEAGLPVDKE
jgi:nitrate reductase gamma subunit